MVDATHNIAVAMCQGTRDRIGIPKARRVQECRCCRTESVRGDFFFRVSHATECGIERVFTHGTLGAARRWENISFAAEHLGQISEIARSEEHTSELQSLMRISYPVFFLKKKKDY